MKQFLLLLFIGTSTMLFAQEEYNLTGGYIADSYDVVSYFKNEKPLKGTKKYQTTFNGYKLKFSSEENLAIFKENPNKYMPQCGGFCAYAVAVKGERVSINPKTFEIRDGKLYLFYNSWGTNTLALWQKEGAEQLKIKADKNWIKIKNSK